jgi:hypothetical protein
MVRLSLVCAVGPCDGHVTWSRNGVERASWAAVGSYRAPDFDTARESQSQVMTSGMIMVLLVHQSMFASMVW